MYMYFKKLSQKFAYVEYNGIDKHIEFEIKQKILVHRRLELLTHMYLRGSFPCIQYTKHKVVCVMIILTLEYFLRLSDQKSGILYE